MLLSKLFYRANLQIEFHNHHETKASPMKTHYPLRAFLCKALLFITFLFYNMSVAQNSIGITFDNEVGCQVYGEDKEKRLFFSDIADGFCLRVCAGSIVNYQLFGTDLSEIDTVEWIASGGTLTAYTSLTSTVQWDGIGFGTLQLNITFDNGSTQTKTICIEKIISPKADFNVYPNIGASEITVCENQPVTFNQSALDNGGTDIVSYYWTFEGNGILETSAEENPTFSFPYSGDYKVTLTVTNECNCSSSHAIEVHVKKPGIVISCPSVACEGQTSNYSVDPSQLGGCTEFNWHVDGGNIVNYSPDHTQIEVVWDNVPASGFGYVSFDATNCNIECPTIVTVMIPVIKMEGTIVGDIVICEKVQARYKLPQWPATQFDWSIDDGGTGSTIILTDQWNEVIVNAGGTGIIKLKCEYKNTLLGCTGTASLTIEILSSISIIGPHNACVGSGITYSYQDGNGNPISGNWSLEGPDGTQTGSGSTFDAIFSEVGTYVFNVSDTYLCSPEVFTVTVVPRPSTPSGISGETTVCPSAPITYTVQNPQPGHLYSWSVVGGAIQGTTFGESVSVIFQPGQPSYSVTVRAIQEEEPHCTSHARTITINVINPIVAINSNDDEVCASSYGTYQSSYTAGDSYNWTIIPADAGSVSTGQGTPTVTVLWNNYTGTTQPQVKLEVFKCGTSYPALFDVDIIMSPQITLSTPLQTICKGEDFTVTITGTPALTDIDHLVWNYGDGTPPVTVYPTAPGVFQTSATISYDAVDPLSVQYNINVTVYGANGCLTPAQATLQMNVMPTPVADISPKVTLVVCDPLDIDITYIANVQLGIGNLDHIEWYHDGILISGANSYSYSPPHVGGSFGEYYAIVYNTNGCSATTNSTYIIENCAPGCSFSPDLGEVSANLTACLTGAASISFVDVPDSFQWAASGGATIVGTPTITNCNFSFSEPGVYVIFYYGTYTVGTETCTFMRTYSLTVPYQADLKYNITCNSNGTYDVELLNHSIVLGGATVTNYQFLVNGSWVNNLGVENYNVNFAAGTTQTVGIKISGPDSPYSCEKIISLVLPAFPDASFQVVHSTCPEDPIQFFPTNVNPDFTYLWTFGDGSFNSVSSPIKVYQSGLYSATLTVTNSVGCASTTAPAEVINVFPIDMEGPVTMLPSGTSCANNPVTLTHNPIAFPGTPPYTYHWMVGTTVVATTNSPSFSPSASGIYWLSITDGNNCKLDIPEGNTVNYIAAPEVVIEGPTSVCSSEEITLDGYTGGANITYSWSDGTSVVGTNPTLTFTPTAAGSTTYTLTVSIPNGTGFCSNTAQHTVEVLQSPPPPAINISNVDCDTYGITLHADTGVAGFYSWSNGASGQNVTVHDGGPYQVRFTNLAGCTSVAQIDIPKAPSAYFWIFPSGCYSACVQENPGFVFGPIEPVFHWDWLIDTNSVDHGDGSIVSQLPIAVSGEYQLYIDNGLCKQTSDPMSITAESCEDCKLDIGIKDIKVNKGEKGFCFYDLYLEITSPFSAPATYSSSIGGTFVPSGFTLVAGTSVAITTFYPPAGFNGGTVTISIHSVIDGKICVSHKEIDFPPCNSSSKIVSGNGDISERVFMQIAPNPGNDFTDIFFSFGTVGDNKTIEVFDMLGRSIIKTEIKEASGKYNLDISKLVSGYYLILMKSDGKVVTHGNLLKN